MNKDTMMSLLYVVVLVMGVLAVFLLPVIGFAQGDILLAGGLHFAAITIAAIWFFIEWFKQRIRRK